MTSADDLIAILLTGIVWTIILAAGASVWWVFA